MRLARYLYLLSFALSHTACSSGKEEAKISASLSEQQFEFEIYDSLVVDYLGNLDIADISGDGESFLLIDHQTDTLVVTDTAGEILYKFKKLGDGPGLYQTSRLGPPHFLDPNEIIIPAYRGFYLYSLSGTPTRSFLPEFTPSISFVDMFHNHLVVRKDQVFYTWEGRIADEIGTEGRKFQLATHRVEVLDMESGKFTPAVPFPAQSKFNTGEKSYLNTNYQTTLASRRDTLYLAFRNEPVIYGYHMSAMEQPASTQKIPFEEFIQKEPKDADVFGKYDMTDLYVGTVQNIHPTEKQRFLVAYSRGLTDQEYEEIFALQDIDKEEFYRMMKAVNKSGLVVFDGNAVSQIIDKPNQLGFTYKFVSEDEIWFTPDFDLFEKDHVVIYKTRISAN